MALCTLQSPYRIPGLLRTALIFLYCSAHGIIGVHRPPLDTKAPGPPLIYLVGPLAISEPHINICVRPPNTCIALKQFNLLPPNTLF